MAIMNLNKSKKDPASNSVPTKPEVKKPASPYDKKVTNLKKKIIVSLSLFAIILVVIISLNFYDKKSLENYSAKFSTLETEIGELETKITSSEERVSQTNKYKKLWISANSKKKNFNGIKISEINDKFTSLAEQYNITNPTITISLPEILNTGIYQLQILDVNLINCNIGFNALTDKFALDFINGFIADLPGYVVINDLLIKKDKKEGYSDQELNQISNGKFPNLISAKVSFSWYFFKHKPEPVT
jgi:hypothetical protein